VHLVVCRYEQEKAAWEAAEKIRQTATATDQLQVALMTRDAPTLRAAISTYGPILEDAGASSRADLELAKEYLTKLDAAAATFARQYAG
jgi:hypothetical protein